jgi:hypothetical protein
MSLDQRLTGRFLLENAATKTANFSLAATTERRLDRFTELVITLAITAATHTTETYDFYITTGDGWSTWDVVHFPQIATTGVKTFTARITSQNQIPTNVTTANPGVSANDTAIFQTDTAGANQGIKTLGAGIVRHAPWGSCLGYELVCAGGGSPSISYTISVQGR